MPYKLNDKAEKFVCLYKFSNLENSHELGISKNISEFTKKLLKLAKLFKYVLIPR